MLFTSFVTHSDLVAGDQRKMTANLKDHRELAYAVEWLTDLISCSRTIDLKDCIWMCVPKDNYFEIVVTNVRRIESYTEMKDRLTVKLD